MRFGAVQAGCCAPCLRLFGRESVVGENHLEEEPRLENEKEHEVVRTVPPRPVAPRQVPTDQVANVEKVKAGSHGENFVDVPLDDGDSDSAELSPDDQETEKRNAELLKYINRIEGPSIDDYSQVDAHCNKSAMEESDECSSISPQVDSETDVNEIMCDLSDSGDSQVSVGSMKLPAPSLEQIRDNINNSDDGEREIGLTHLTLQRPMIKHNRRLPSQRSPLASSKSASANKLDTSTDCADGNMEEQYFKPIILQEEEMNPSKYFDSDDDKELIDEHGFSSDLDESKRDDQSKIDLDSDAGSISVEPCSLEEYGNESASNHEAATAKSSLWLGLEKNLEVSSSSFKPTEPSKMEEKKQEEKEEEEEEEEKLDETNHAEIKPQKMIWQELKDAKTGRYYYFNGQQSVWTKPFGFDRQAIQAAKEERKNGLIEWVEARDEHGRVYWFDKKTMKSRWDRPPTLSLSSLVASSPRGSLRRIGTGESENGESKLHSPRSPRSPRTLAQAFSKSASKAKSSAYGVSKNAKSRAKHVLAGGLCSGGTAKS